MQGDGEGLRSLAENPFLHQSSQSTLDGVHSRQNWRQNYVRSGGNHSRCHANAPLYAHPRDVSQQPKLQITNLRNGEISLPGIIDRLRDAQSSKANSISSPKCNRDRCQYLSPETCPIARYLGFSDARVDRNYSSGVRTEPISQIDRINY